MSRAFRLDKGASYIAPGVGQVVKGQVVVVDSDERADLLIASRMFTEVKPPVKKEAGKPQGDGKPSEPGKPAGKPSDEGKGGKAPESGKGGK